MVDLHILRGIVSIDANKSLFFNSENLFHTSRTIQNQPHFKSNGLLVYRHWKIPQYTSYKILLGPGNYKTLKHCLTSLIQSQPTLSSDP